jgi:hypothetical protein
LINNNNDNCAPTSHKKTQQQTKETNERERERERENHRPTGCEKGISRVRKTPLEGLPGFEGLANEPFNEQIKI